MQVKKILAVRTDRFGEFLLNIPAFHALKIKYPGAKLSLLVNPYLRELAEAIEGVDRVITWENKKHGFFELLKFSFGLRKDNFDLCVIFNPSKEINIAAFLAGIPVRVGYNHKAAIFLTHKM